ncbi:MAG: PIG-L family deacetylase [Deltaproteobacteria bacterium]|nr:PIG-L family deacetylase [Deltaproteobacteria bacterium]
MTQKEIILIIASHPDDEILGCGGTIAKYSRQGAEVYPVILAEGATSRGLTKGLNRNSKKNPELKNLKEAAKNAAKILGTEIPIFLNFPDNQLDKIPLLKIIQKIEPIIKKIKPNILWTHHGYDINIDHQITHQAAITAARALPGSSIQQILFFETPSSTDYQIQSTQTAFLAQWFEDITSTLELKMKALEAYHLEMRAWPHLRSYEAIEALAKYRGAMAGFCAAEAFMLGRKMVA